jgi:flagellar export protein FliJ
MSGDLKPRIKRLRRLLDLRETLSDAAEAGVRESEQQVRNLEAAKRTLEENIRDARTEASKSQTLSGHRLRVVERFVESLERRSASAQYNIEKTTAVLERRRSDWVEALRQQRIVERSLKRRSLEWQRLDDASTQKLLDDSYNGKIARDEGKGRRG